MNQKQFTTLLVLVLVLGGFGLFISKRRQGDWKETSSGAGQKLAGQFDLNAVARIHIKSAAGELNVGRKDDAWTVKERGDYPANFFTIADFVRKLADAKTVQSEQVGASQHARLELEAPGKGEGRGTLVELVDKDGKTLKSLLLGKRQLKKTEGGQFGGGEMPVARWVLDTTRPGNVSLVSETFSDAEPRPENWLEKEFFKVEHLKSVAVSFATNAAGNWRAVRETESAEWKLDAVRPDEHVDTNKVSGLGSPLSSPSFADLAVDPKPETTGFDQGVEIRLETFDGFTYSARVGKLSGAENYFFNIQVAGDFAKARKPAADEKPEDKDRLDKEFQDKLKQREEKLAAEKKFERWTYLTSKWTVDPVLKLRSDFYAEKKEEPKPDAAPPFKIPGIN